MNTLIAVEIRRTGGYCKMDFEKAYDHINWVEVVLFDSSLYFLNVVFGFGEWLLHGLL
jgi:hypothetical protein